MEAAYGPGEWVNFAIGLATASGALAGLVFVAISLHAAEVLGSAFHRRRAESTFVILLGILTASLLLLLPGQGRVAVGIEMLGVGAVLAYRTARTWPVLRTGLAREAVLSYLAGAITHALIVLGAIGLLSRTGGGLYVAAAGLVLALVRTLIDIWILFTGFEQVAVTSSAAAPERGDKNLRGQTGWIPIRTGAEGEGQARGRRSPARCGKSGGRSCRGAVLRFRSGGQNEDTFAAT